MTHPPIRVILVAAALFAMPIQPAARADAGPAAAKAPGEVDFAISCGRAAADLDATMDKHPATPAVVQPARELYADLLLELKDPGAALKEYEESLKAEPNRFRSILGKARAAKEAGELAASREAYQKLVALSGQAGAGRPELAEAKAFLTN